MSEEKSIFKTNHDTEEYESSYDDSEPETTDDYKNIPGGADCRAGKHPD